MKNLINKIKEENEKIKEKEKKDSLNSSMEALVFADFKPKLIEDDNDPHIAFGISKDRAKYFSKMIGEIVSKIVESKNSNIPKLIVEICQLAVHPNEVVYLVATTVAIIGKVSNDKR